MTATAAIEYFMRPSWALYAYVAMGNGTAEMIQKYGTDAQRKNMSIAWFPENGAAPCCSPKQVPARMWALIHLCGSKPGRHLFPDR
ncbi:MAG: hypothetical protein R2860_04700 [Desulfobacterales bacterium]